MGKQLVMVIEQDHSILEVITMLLEGNGFHVLKYLTPPALPLSDQPDLILLDIGYNSKQNRAFYDALKPESTTETKPIILLSTLNGLSDVARGWKADAFISKPFDISVLLSTVEFVLSSHKQCI